MAEDSHSLTCRVNQPSTPERPPRLQEPIPAYGPEAIDTHVHRFEESSECTKSGAPKHVANHSPLTCARVPAVKPAQYLGHF
jgi:hypothetical protein